MAEQSKGGKPALQIALGASGLREDGLESRSGTYSRASGAPPARVTLGGCQCLHFDPKGALALGQGFPEGEALGQWIRRRIKGDPLASSTKARRAGGA